MLAGDVDAGCKNPYQLSKDDTGTKNGQNIIIYSFRQEQEC